MKQTIKSILAFAAVLICGGAWADAGDVISIDVGGNAAIAGDQKTLAGTIPVAGWVKSNTVTLNTLAVTKYNLSSGQTTTIDGANVSWVLSSVPAGLCTVGNFTFDNACAYFKTGLCRGNAGQTDYTLTVSGIPFESYQVYVYFTYDSRYVPSTHKPFPGVVCNGVGYSISNNTMVQGNNDDWGTEITDFTSPTVGVNAMSIPNQTGSTLTLTGDTTCGAIAAVQIVETVNPTQLYYNQLAGGARVPAGTYGAISIDESTGGYKATAYSSNTGLNGTGVGSFANVGSTKNGRKMIDTHTIAGWFKVGELPTGEATKDLFVMRTGTDNYNGYKVVVDANGVLKIGRTNYNNGNYSWNDNKLVSLTGASGAIASDTWFHLAIAFTYSSNSDNNFWHLTPIAWVNGVEATKTGDAYIDINLNGPGYVDDIRMGAGISAAGIYVDSNALSSADVIKAIATNSTYVCAVKQAGFADWSNLDSTARCGTHFGKSGADLTFKLNPTTECPLGTTVAISTIKIANGNKSMADTITINGAVGTKQSSTEPFTPKGEIGSTDTIDRLFTYQFATPAIVAVGHEYPVTMASSNLSAINDANSPILISGLSGQWAGYNGYCSIETEIKSFPSFSYDGDPSSNWVSTGLEVAQEQATAFLDGLTSDYVFAMTFGASSMDRVSRNGTVVNPVLHDDGVMTVEFQVVNGGWKKMAFVGFKVEGGYLKVKRLKSAYVATTFEGPMMTYSNGTITKANGVTENNSAYPLAKLSATQLDPVATIEIDGETKTYRSLARAIKDAGETGAAITLLQSNVDPSAVTVPAETTITFANGESFALNATAAFGGTGNVVLEFHTPESYASTSDLIAYMKAAPTTVTFKFFGANTTGFTLDFASANTTVNSHVVFVGGAHTYKWKNDDRRWAANGTYENPNILVEEGTTLNFIGHDITGYNGSNMNGVIRVKRTGVLNFSKYGNGTVYFTQKIALDPGSTMNVTSDMDNLGFRMTGGNAEHIYVAESASTASEEGRTATINVADNKWSLPKDAGSTMGVVVGENSILKFNGGIKNDGTGAHEFYKKGAGSIVITGTFEPKFILSEGSATLSKMPSSLGTVAGALTIADTAVTSIDLGATLITGSVDLTGCTALTTVLVPDAGRDASAALNVTLPGSVADVTRVYTETREEYANCSFKVANATDVVVKVRHPDGTLAETTVGADGFAKMSDFGTEIRITGWATAFDVTYENTSEFVHKDVSGASSQADTTITYNKEGTGHDVGARLKHHPYINNIGDAWFEATEALTLAVVGTMSEKPRTTFIHMGYSITDYTGLLIATGDKKDEVIIGWNENNTSTKNKVVVHEITRMSVPNAASERHVYVVTKSDVGDKSTFTVYLDGKNWKTVTIDRITIKGGVQVGSDFGGIIRALPKDSPSYFADVANDEANNNVDNTGLVNLIRVYDRVITEAEIKEYSKADQYPYYPPHGASTRVFAGETANWIESDDPAVAWSVTPKDGSATPANAPAEGSSLSTTLSAENAMITVNVPADGIIYEELEVIGSGSATFAKGANSGAISVSGTATLYRPITVKPGAIDFSKTPITLLEDGALTFDYSDYDVTTTYVTTKVNLTGEVAQNDSKITFTPPTNKPYRTVEMSYDAGLQQYVMTITPNHQNGATLYYDSENAARGNNADKLWTAATEPKSKTCAFPNDTIVFGQGSFSCPSWINPAVVGSVFEFAKDMTISYAADDSGKLFDGKTVKVDGTTLTLKGHWRAISLGTITTSGANGKIVFTAASDHGYANPTADAISGTAKVVVSDGITLTVTGSVGSPVEVNGTIKAGAEIATITTTKPNCFVSVTVAGGVYTYTPVEVTGEDPLPLDDIKPGESVTPAQDAKPIWSDTAPDEGEGGKYIKVVDGALVVKSGAPVNGLDSFTSYVLGLDPEVATSKPYLSGADTTSTTTLKLIPAGVTVKEGYTVTPKLRVGTTPDSFSDDPTALTDGGFTITLPTEENDKVKYYQIEYTISK